jgi:branched-chain amino acid aminotransferase
VIGEGVAGPVTRALQAVYSDALHGRDERYRQWLDIVQVPSRTAAGG